MSIILTPHGLPVSELPLVGMKTNLGIVMALKKLDAELNPKIKWPNDIYLQDKKLCGILIENAIAGNKVQHIIIGIGINVNERQFPQDLPKATSIFIATGIKHDLYEVASVIRHYVIDMVDVSDLYWKQTYDASLFGLEKEYAFEKEGEIIHAKVKGVDEQGRIQLSPGNEQIESYYSHEIKWILE
jgi:BirA family biotin operon repressor/biotin-[acetyl-CoA-carboxylase] ligase